MKFFSTALAAFAVGSAVAAPVLDVLAPCPCKDESGVGAPGVALPSPCTAPEVNTPEIDAPVPNPGQVGSGGHVDNSDVIVVVDAVVKTVVSVEAKVHAHLDLVASIIANADIDVQALVKVLVDLEVDLKVLQDCVPQLDGLVLDVDVLVEADLKVILDLVVRVQALIAEVEVSLKALVVLKADVLAVIGVELQACLGLVEAIANPIVKAVLAIIANVTVHLDIVTKITDLVGEITNTCTGLGGLLAPVFKLLNL